MQTSRQKILTHLRKTRSASAREIARALKMSSPNVRYHLSMLCSDGRVEIVSTIRRERRGRPEKVFSLSEASQGDNMPALTAALLAEAGTALNVQSLAGHMLKMDEFEDIPFSKRLGILVERLNAMHYQARWEAGAEGPRILPGRCPYARIDPVFPVICQMDEALIQEAMGRPVMRLQKNETGGRSACPFVFQIG